MTDPIHAAFPFVSLRLDRNGVQKADENLDRAELERDVDERVTRNGLSLPVDHSRLPQRPS
jgi:hypothetical protein